MLKYTFIHIPRVGKTTERNIWEAGVSTWNDFQYGQKRLGVPDDLLKHYLELSHTALLQRDIVFFSQFLPSSESWRLYPQITHQLNLKVAYLDIETSGTDYSRDKVTVVGIFDGQTTHYYVKGINLNDLYEDITQYDLLVTFNGKCFDVPFLQVAMPGIRLPQAHIDLRYVLRKLQLSGGLKSIEKQTGLARAQDELGRLDGYDAVVLWQLHEQGEKQALPTLLRYNAEDVVGLKPLLELACHTLMAQLPLNLPPFPISKRMTPDIPYSRELIRNIKRVQEQQQQHYHHYHQYQSW